MAFHGRGATRYTDCRWSTRLVVWWALKHVHSASQFFHTSITLQLESQLNLTRWSTRPTWLDLLTQIRTHPDTTCPRVRIWGTDGLLSLIAEIKSHETGGFLTVSASADLGRSEHEVALEPSLAPCEERVVHESLSYSYTAQRQMLFSVLLDVQQFYVKL